MNYEKIYNSIISAAKRRVRPSVYCETHHITPKSMGGSDCKSNLVSLTAREHFIAHWLLYKIHRNMQMTCAFFYMTKPVGNGRVRYTSRNFESARKAWAKWMSKNRSGQNSPLYGLRGESSPNYGSRRNGVTKMKLSEHAKKRKGEKNPKARKVMCTETGEVFGSIRCASNFAKKGNVSYAIKSGGTAGGYHFAYVDDAGKPIEQEVTLKGYVKGSKVHNAVKVINKDNGSIFDTARDAAKSIGVTPQAVMWAIRNNKKCKGVWFERI